MARRRRTIFREAARTLRVADRAACRLAVISDTHGRPHPALFERLSAAQPDAIFHAGDVGDPWLLDRLDTIAPVVAVRGNIDPRDAGLPDGLVLTVVDGAGPLLVAYLTHVGVRTARLLGAVRDRARAVGAALVVCGHSHVPLLVRDGDLVVFNPGSAGPRRFHLPIVFGVVDSGPGGVSLRHVDCETGERWTPPPG